MSKLAFKFLIGIVGILTLSTILAALINAGFIERYYVHQKKASIHQVGGALALRLESGGSAEEAMSELEAQENVVIVELDQQDDNAELNEELRAAFREKGIGFQKYWLWDQDYQDTLENGRKVRIYRQNKLNYSILVEYLQIDSKLYAIAMIIPNIADAFRIINGFLIAVNIMAALVAVLFILTLIKRVTRPLKAFEAFAGQMERHRFCALTIKTNDELELVADSLNKMGREIRLYQKSLTEKNRQMEQFLNDAAHELKTPVSLIKLYAKGMKDGMDDGTFLDTIIRQNRQMEQMVGSLLFLSGSGGSDLCVESFDLSALLAELLKEYAPLAADRRIEYQAHLEENIRVESDAGLVRTVLSNFLSNAVKYASAGPIEVTLSSGPSAIRFRIANRIGEPVPDVGRIWDPYYVGEESRNKHLSGTGLGLPIVKRIADRLGYRVDCEISGQEILFSFEICKNIAVAGSENL